MGLAPRQTPRTLTFSGLQRLGRTPPAPQFEAQQTGVQPLPVTGSNAGQGAAIAGQALGQTAGALAQRYQGEQAASLAAALSRAEALLDTSLTEAANKTPENHQAFQAASDEIGKAWLAELPPELQRQAETVFIHRRERLKRAVLENERQALRRADNAELLGRADKAQAEAFAAARSGNAEEAAAHAQVFMAARESLWQGGFLTPAQYVAAGKDFADGLDRQEVLQAFDGAKQGGLAAGETFIRRFLAGEGADNIVDPDQRQRLALEMSRDLAVLRAEYNARVKAAEDAWKARFGEHKDSVKVAAEAVAKGRTFAGFEDLKTEMQAGAAEDPQRYGPLVQTLAEAERLAKVMEGFAALPPGQQRDVLDTAVVRTAGDNDLMDSMEEVHKRTVAAMKEDPHGYAAAHLPPEYQSPPLAMGDPVSFAASLQQRAAATARLTAWNGNQPVSFLRPGEAAALRDAFQGMSPSDQAIYLHSINQNAGPAAFGIYEALSKEAPALAHIGGLAALGPQHHGVAEAALTGLQAEGVDLPLDASIWFADETGSTFAAAPRARVAVKQTADAIYKAEALRRGLTKDSADEDLYREAVQKALGRAQNGAGEATGGIADINGQAVPVPPGMTAERLRTVFNALRGPAGVIDLTVMSTGGGAPRDDQGNAFDPRVNALYPIAAGGSRYFLSLTNPATDGVTYVRGTGPGGRFEFDVTRMSDKLDARTERTPLGAIANAVADLAGLAGESVPDVDWQAALDNSGVRLRPLDELATKDDLIGLAARTLRDSNISLPELDKTAEAPGLVGASARLLRAITRTGVEAPPPEFEVFPRSPFNRNRDRADPRRLPQTPGSGEGRQ